MSRILALIAMTSILMPLGSALHGADSWAPPRPRVFASEQGSFGFKVLEPKFRGTSVGALFELDQDGSERTLWIGKLVNVPSRVFVSEDGQRVVTIDTYGRPGYEHCIVVYDEKGRTLADYKLEDLFTQTELAVIPKSVSSRQWVAYTSFAFDRGKSQFVVSLNLAKLFKVQIDTAKRNLAKTSSPYSETHWKNLIAKAEAGLKQAVERAVVIDLNSGKLMANETAVPEAPEQPQTPRDNPS